VAGTPNGVVGVKITTSPWDEFPASLHAWGIGDGQSDAWVGALLPRAAVVVLRRRDRVGQAISWWRAKQTGRFARFVDEAELNAMPPYDFAQLRAALADIARLDMILARASASLRTHAAAVTMELTYEDAILDPAGAVRRIADLAEVSLDACPALSTDLVVQRDEATDAIRTRFEADLASDLAEAAR
jgi:LPS sulfotransferase NodH